MKREEVKNKIPGITDEQLDWLMSENGTDINREKAAAAIQTQLDKANAQLRTAQDGLAKFDSVDVEDLKAQVKKLTDDIGKALEAAAGWTTSTLSANFNPRPPRGGRRNSSGVR